MTSTTTARLIRPTVIVVVALAVVSVVVWILESVGLRDASAVYLLAVVLTAVLAGTWPAIASAIGAFLIYDFLFIEPRFTFTVRDPQEWLNLLLLLVIGIVVGRLAGRERDRAETAIAREREATAMFQVSFALASSTTATQAFPAIVEVIQSTLSADRAWIEVGDRVVADSGTGIRPRATVHSVLGRRPGDEPAQWTRIHVPAGSAGRRQDPGTRGSTTALYRVVVRVDELLLGAIWIERRRSDGEPDAGATRLVSAAADQIGRAIDRDRLAAEAASAEVARRSDILKSALLDSVSHDLRTPLASIRAAAGTLSDPALEWSAEERRAIAGSIDAEAERLNRLVSNLLDMSRIEAGELRPTTAAFVLEDLIEGAIARSTLRRRERPVEVHIPPDLPPVEVDEVQFGQVVLNILENAASYAGDGARLRVQGTRTGDQVTVTIDDDGPGVPDEALPRLFEKFYRVPRGAEGSRRGTGTGLAVVRGLVEAMGGSASARRSEFGGLAIDLAIPVARHLPDADTSPAATT